MVIAVFKLMRQLELMIFMGCYTSISFHFRLVILMFFIFTSNTNCMKNHFVLCSYTDILANILQCCKKMPF